MEHFLENSFDETDLMEDNEGCGLGSGCHNCSYVDSIRFVPPPAWKVKKGKHRVERPAGAHPGVPVHQGKEEEEDGEDVDSSFLSDVDENEFKDVFGAFYQYMLRVIKIDSHFSY